MIMKIGRRDRNVTHCCYIEGASSESEVDQ